MKDTIGKAMSKRLKLSFESIDISVNKANYLDKDGAIISPLSPATNEPILEAQETELIYASTEIKNIGSEFDTSVYDVATLESIQSKLQGLEGPIISVSYEMFHITMEQMYRKHGISTTDVIPSLESFNDDNDKSITISLEAVNTTIAAFIETVKQLIKRLLFTAAEFIKSTLSFNFTILKRLKAIKERAEAIDDETDKPMIKLHTANKLLIKGSLPPREILVSVYHLTAGHTVDIASGFKAFFGSIVEHRQMIRQGKRDGLPREELEKKITDSLESKGTRKLDWDEYLNFRNPVFTATRNSFGFTKIHYTYSDDMKRDEDSTNYQMLPLTPSQIISICTYMEKSVAGIKEVSQSYDVGQLKKDVLDEDVTNDDYGKIDKASLATIKHALSTHTKVLKYLVQTNKAMLVYCVQSLNAYSK